MQTCLAYKNEQILCLLEDGSVSFRKTSTQEEMRGIAQLTAAMYSWPLKTKKQQKSFVIRGTTTKYSGS